MAGYDKGTGPSLYWLDYLATLHKVNTGGTGYGECLVSVCGGFGGAKDGAAAAGRRGAGHLKCQNCEGAAAALSFV